MHIIGHRGAAHYAPENTMKAIIEGLKRGADGIEIDTHRLASGEMIVTHDSNFIRTAKVYLDVSKAMLATVSKLRFDGERIPTLAEVLDFVPDGKLLQIELKSDIKTVPTLISTIKASKKKLDDVMIIGFGYDAMVQSKSMLPQVKVAWINGQKSAKMNRMHDRKELLHLLKAGKLDAVDFDQSFDIDKSYVDFMSENGIEMFSWTVDKMERQNYFAEIGIKGVATNKPNKVAT